MELNKKIRRLREEHNLSLEKFGNLIDVSDTAVLKWEQGLTEPKASNLKALANNFNISIDELLEITPKLNDALKKNNNFTAKKNNGTLISNSNINIKNNNGNINF